MAETLRTWLASKQPGRPVFKMPDKPVKLIKADLKAAREAWLGEAPSEKVRKEREKASFLKYRDSAGRVADFHALRHTYISRLVRAGVAPAVAKSLARHSTIMLTMDHYTHVSIEEEQSALARLPELGAKVCRAEGLRTTGTEDCVAHA